ncbi:MAG: hypothetical protein ACTSRZ_01595, partial [Promethearchaeota archaeon]
MIKMKFIVAKNTRLIKKLSIFCFILLIMILSVNNLSSFAKSKKEIVNSAILSSDNNNKNPQSSDNKSDLQQLTLKICDSYANRDHPYENAFTIPKMKIKYGYIKVEAYCDPDDPYLRAINIYFDDKGGSIGCYNIAPGQVRGDTILPGEHKVLYYDLENIQFAADSELGSFYINLLKDKNPYGNKFLSPGIHKIKAFITSYDYFSGPTQESWISIKLYLNQENPNVNPQNENEDDLEQLTLNIFNAYSNWDNPHESTFTIPDMDIQYGYMKVEAYCDPEDPYLRAINIYFDDKG